MAFGDQIGPISELKLSVFILIVFKHRAHIPEIFNVVRISPENRIDFLRVNAHEFIEHEICAFDEVHGGDGLYLKVGAHEKEDDATEGQGVDYGGEEVPRLVRREVLSEQGPHHWCLPEEKRVDEQDLEDAGDVGDEHSQTEHHAEKNEQENVQDGLEVLHHEPERQEVIDADAENDRDSPKEHFRQVVLFGAVGECDEHALA